MKILKMTFIIYISKDKVKSNNLIIILLLIQNIFFY
jgi:hypothetical protein